MVSKVNSTLAIALLCAAAYASSQIDNEINEELPADDDIRELMPTVLKQLRGKYPSKIASLEAVTYRDQETMAPPGFIVYVRAIVTEQRGKKKAYIHLRVLEPYEGEMKLQAIKTDVDEKTPLEPFRKDRFDQFCE